MSDSLLYTVEDGLARIILNRPARLNAFDDELAEAWDAATADAVDRDDVGAILVGASGRHFCAGGDVMAMAMSGMHGSDITRLAGVINRGITALTGSAKPVVASAQGTTAGGGLGILLATDYAVVGESSRLGSLYANIGLTPDLSVSAQLARAVGERRALQLVLQDRMLSAEEALEWGLIAEVVADDQVEARAEAIARFWLDGAFAAYGQAKRLVRDGSRSEFAHQIDAEAQSIGTFLDTPEAQARIAAFAAASTRRSAEKETR
ncbi:enoyl-CoA hydratase [Microbacterium sp. Root61]|uniref:enoyl-CoA hydratase/isomerase family protein n=1 Tax=Microbacterium sp. Root61 TaxID=1736570 RepID=UPI0006FBAE8B|nr:enoyl-CoA hydratase/isomerase family protein [Microbacterium sp. Root61]KRA25544.1 enoyl-CoA hydratase [Microbacterium sp. Root61]